MEHHFRIPILSKDNYQRWIFDLTAALKSKKVLGVADGTIKMEDQEAAALETWNENDGKSHVPHQPVSQRRASRTNQRLSDLRANVVPNQWLVHDGKHNDKDCSMERLFWMPFHNRPVCQFLCNRHSIKANSVWNH